MTVDFFDPENGPFWQMYFVYLSPFLKENNGKYSPRVVKGMVKLSFSPELADCMVRAGKITDVFYKGNKRREWKFTITPRESKISAANISIGKKETDIIKKSGVQFLWPIRNENIAMKFDLTDKNGNRCPKFYKSQWDLMYLMNRWVERDHSSGARDAFNIKIDLVSSGGYHFLLPAKMQVFDSKNPFYENVFMRFRIPERIVQ